MRRKLSPKPDNLSKPSRYNEGWLSCNHALSPLSLSCTVTVAITWSSRTLDCIAHTILRPDRQMTVGVPLILDVVWRPLKGPVSQCTTALKLFLQSFSIWPQFSVGPVLSPDLKAVINKLVRDVAGVFVDLFWQRLHLEHLAVSSGESATKFVIMRVVDWIITIAAIYDAGYEVIVAIWRIRMTFGSVTWIIDSEAKMIDTALIVSGG